jgi:small-conductance mechanosensitive channel
MFRPTGPSADSSLETSGFKETIEKISIRSLSLRNPPGAVATVPYGQIGKVINFSREWVIEKCVFRVTFDTDVDLVRKLFKKIGRQLAENPEFAPDLLEPFKSQGLDMVEDGILLLRGKFKARAGKKAAMAAVQHTCTENSIKAAP